MSTTKSVFKEKTIGSVPATTGAISRWLLDEGTGTLAEDSVGSNDGTLTSASWTGSGNFGYSGDDSVALTAGSSSYVIVPDHASLDDITTGSIEFWVKPAYTGTPSSFRGFLSKASTSAVAALYGCYHYTDGIIYFHLNSGGGLNMGFFQPVAGTWYHIVITWDGANARSYLNGSLLATTATVAASGNSTLPFYIGAYVYNTSTIVSYSGSIDCVTIYGATVLSAATILSNYRNGYQKPSLMLLDGTDQLIEEVEIPVSSTSRGMLFTYPLDGDTDGGYRIELLHISGTAANNLTGLSINNLAFASNDAARSYMLQTGAGTISGAYNATTGGIGGLTFVQSTATTAKVATATIEVFPSKTGVDRFIHLESTKGNTTANLVEYWEISGLILAPVNSVNIQSLAVVNNTTSGFGAGSTARLYKLNKSSF